MSDSVVTLGCRLNLAESETIRGLISGAEQRTVVVNSCAVTAEAVRQSRRAVRRLRAANPDARLLVTGCAATIDPDAFAAMPEVDGVVANAAKLDAAAWVERPAPVAPLVPAPRHTRAFVPVQTGCDHACTFCIIPAGRGTSVSQPIAAVLHAVEGHLASGTREVVLTGVDVTGWGADLPGSPRLGDLVAAILRAFPALPRLRLSSLDGVEIDGLLFELITGEMRVMPHVHLSLQAGHDLTLKRMKRRHTRAEAVTLSQRLRAARPDIAIGADLIAGFPTEDAAMHEANVAIVADCGIVHGHVFPYSPRPGTPAARMPQVPRPVVRARAAEVRAAVAATRARWLEGLIGHTREVLAERDGTGHSPEFAPYRLPEGSAPGTLVTLTPTRIREGLLE
ncbi:MiaB/RimO family radical SAM methylthiotransferase [Novosphingobium sp. PASSN1]|uniref:MiaB/RimO family radical SAM methylthiotransferase n=1 Tax=Novosphingobium sp. PASSN1 TaxID=2015561 RepID=UPI000BC7D32B|nr:MiaB/RimO family radical SAM methylthiotransferase [Novosphingobium sp. PASSN1]OYU34885.1 MAG: tRNA (N(6)-L-threonylcarbamoyladenosine(37)-C(2))-methylthiotransferase MtaB [Novosphingobium sp. PASSN1]